MAGQPGEAMLLRQPRQCCDHGGGQRPGAAHIDVEAAIGGGDLDVERLVRRFQHVCERARRVQRTVEAGIEDGTTLDSDDGVAARGGKTDAQFAIVPRRA